MQPRQTAGVFLLGFALMAAACSGTEEPAADDRPNIMLIVTDDQRLDTMWTMPQTRRLLGGSGVTFDNGFVVNTLCCPSRATILTGTHAHTHGVYTNAPPDGGFPKFDDRSTVATWLDEAGYRTGMFGKYFNSYDDASYVPPGWDEWAAFSSDAGNGGAYIDYELSVNGRPERYGRDESDYSTDVLAAKAAGFVRASDGPFFLEFAPFAPHGPLAAPRHRGRFADLKELPPAGWNEVDVSDKPRWVRDLPLGSYYEPHFGELESLLAVDEAVAGLIDALEEEGELDNTFILFTSDHGTSWGEHRYWGKGHAYDQALRVPFLVRYDRLIERGMRDKRFVLNLDIAPTLADLAGVDAPGAEGHSLLPLLRGEDREWRSDFLFEHLEWKRAMPTYCGVRDQRFSYVAYATGEEELYDMERDPAQLDNLAEAPSMQQEIKRLRARVTELCTPPPPGWEPPNG